MAENMRPVEVVWGFNEPVPLQVEEFKQAPVSSSATPGWVAVEVPATKGGV